MKRVCKRVSIAVILAFLFFIFLEVFLHVFLHQKLRKRHFAAIFKPDTAYGYSYIPYAKDYACNPAYRMYVEVNSKGFWFREFSEAKKPGTFRILFSGSSDEGYVYYLSNFFNKYHPKVEVIDCSIPGDFREVQRIKYITGEVLKYQPDIVVFPSFSTPFRSKLEFMTSYKDFQIVAYTLDEIENIKQYIEETHEVKSLFHNIYDLFYSFRYVCKYYTENDNQFSKLIGKIGILKDKKKVTEYVQREVKSWKGFEIKDISVKGSVEILKDLNESIKANGGKLVVSNKRGKSPLMKYYLSLLEIPYLDMTTNYDKSFTYGDADGHSSPAGHYKVSEVFFKEIVNSGLIPQKYLNKEFLQQEDTDTTKNELISLESLNLAEIPSTKSNESSKVQIVRYLNSPDSKDQDINFLTGSYDDSSLDFKIVRSELDDVNNMKKLINKLNESVTKNKPTLVVLPLPFNIVNADFYNSFELLIEYKSFLNKNGIALITYYTYYPRPERPVDTNTKLLLKHTLAYLLEEEEISCKGILVNISNEEMKNPESKEIKDGIIANGLIDIIKEKSNLQQ